MSKRILLIGGNFSPELTGIGKYNGEMIECLAKNGFDCTVLTTFPYYPQWKVQEHYKKNSYWYKRELIGNTNPVKIIRCPHYIPRNPSGVKRLLSDLSTLFSTLVAMLPLLFQKKYDHVIIVAPPFMLGLLGIFYKKVRGSQFIYHIQDLQVDAARDLNMIRSESLIKLLFTIEKFILNHADVVSTISKGMMNKIKNRCNKEVAFFPNWVDLDAFYPIKNKKALKVKFGFDPTDKIVLYSGAIGKKQGLEAIIHSAKFLEGNTNVKFVICGFGPYKENLISLQKKLHLKNVIFLPLQPANLFNQFLNMADVHLILQKSNASDLVLPSKLSAVLAIGGISLVSADPGTSLYEIMHTSDMGYVIQPENQDALNTAILNAIENNNEEKEKNARSYAETFLCINSILLNFSENVLKQKPAQELRKSLKIELLEPAQ